MSSLPELKLSEVLHALKPIELKYFEVGVQLDVSVETLQVIKEENLTFSLRLCKTIDSWHKNTSSERCTWSTLADAVARVGGHDNLVRELRKRGNNAPVSQQPSEDNSEDTGYSTKSDSAISDTESSSGSETERFELVPECGCKEKPCSLPTLCARGCPNPTRRRIPVLQKKRVSVVTQDDLPFEDEDDCEDFERETKKIQKCSGDFVTDVCYSFKKRNVGIEMLTLYLQSSFPVLKPRSKELNEAKSMEQVFKIVVDQACSWFDYEVIVSIIEKFGESSDKRRAEVYKEEFKKYAEQRLPKGKKHIEIGSGAKVGTKQLVVKIDKEWEEVNFNDLDKLRGSFATILGIRRTDLYLADVREGCIMMTFMIQEELAKKLFPKKSCLTAEQIHSLKSESVITVKCGKLIWRASAMASNKVEPADMPIEPQTWGASTTANDTRHSVTDIDAMLLSIFEKPFADIHSLKSESDISCREPIVSRETLEDRSIRKRNPLNEISLVSSLMMYIILTLLCLISDCTRALMLPVVLCAALHMSIKVCYRYAPRTFSCNLPFCDDDAKYETKLDWSQQIWITVTVGIFYALPALQLVLSEIKVHHFLDQDDPYKWSSIGSILLGILFVIIVFFRHWQHIIRRNNIKEYINSYGVPQFFWIYYAMGFALILEGSCYLLRKHHIYSNFQFDTMFIFITGGIILKVYWHNCHLHVQTNSFTTYFTSAVNIFLTLGILQYLQCNDCTSLIVKIFSFLFLSLFIIVPFLAHSPNRWKEFWGVQKYRINLIIFGFNVPLGIFILYNHISIATEALVFYVLNFIFIYCVSKVYYGKLWTWLALLLPVIIGASWLVTFHIYLYGTITEWTFMLALMIELLTLKWKHLLKEQYKLTNHFN